MAKQQDKSSKNIKGKNNGYTHIFISRLTNKPTFSLYYI